ncbi:sigma factor-like helix-turn-helix DNA-binding protein [Streptomyces sp. NPDC053069]|uniref:sigma factor-like helix-turn-helix DNA-binding protein n=1 Tax=Streptomyces sp. NPDC053069 TaxID=3365695 RepID=UPI0037D7497F
MTSDNGRHRQHKAYLAPAHVSEGAEQVVEDVFVRRTLALVETAAFAEVRHASRSRFTVPESKLGLYAAIGRLPERQCEVILLRFMLGHPMRRLAELMGISTGRSEVSCAERGGVCPSIWGSTGQRKRWKRRKDEPGEYQALAH